MSDLKATDGLLLAALPHVPFDGWSVAALRAGARDIALGEEEALALFPRGGSDAVAAFSRWADRQMLAAIAGPEYAVLRVRDRIAAAIRARLAALALHREAVRGGLAVLAQPQHAALGLRLLYETVDTIWYAAGDTATDFNFYTKRLLLGGVLAATMLYWLDDRSPGSVDTHGFLDRRLADAMALPKIGKRLRAVADRLPNPFRFVQAARRR